MGGVHIAYRASGNDLNGERADIFTGIISKLILPEKVSMKDNISETEKGGGFPEFFHGFYKSSYGLDTGVIYAKTEESGIGYYLFVNGHDNTCSWNQTKTKIPVPANRTIYLKSFVADNYICNRVYSDSALQNQIDQFDVKISDGAYAAMRSGAVINREISLAVNRRKSTGRYDLPMDAYFSMAEFTESRMIMPSGQTVRMTAENSHLSNPYNSSTKQYEPAYDDAYEEFARVFKGDLSQLNQVARGDYVSDKCCASINGRLVL